MFRTRWNTLWVTGTSVALTAVLALFWPIPADAGLVSGRVNDGKGKFPPSGMLRVKDSKGKVVKDSLKTDEFRGYSIFLPPGLYTVEFPDGRTAVIQSHPEPIRQDIYLK